MTFRQTIECGFTLKFVRDKIITYSQRSEDICVSLTLSQQRSLSYRNQCIDLQSKSMDWFLQDRNLRQERVNTFQANIPFLYRSSHQNCSVEIGVLKNFPKFTGKHLRQSLFFNKVARAYACNFIKKETLAQLFSCEFCGIFKNTYFYRTTLVAATVGSMILS